MKKIICLLLFSIILLSSCDIGFGSGHTSSPADYGEWNKSFVSDHPFLPDSIEGYTVNSYSYTYYAYMDICYEIFLDLTVSAEQLEALLAAARADKRPFTERDAYYAEGYCEIVFTDVYELCDFDEANVGWADIEKVVYNAKSGNIIYECFHANDTGVYEVANVAFFKRFSINHAEYARGAEKAIQPV